jgi:hypothetical protein
VCREEGKMEIQRIMWGTEGAIEFLKKMRERKEKKFQRRNNFPMKVGRGKRD